MKGAVKKLALNKETVRALQDTELGRIVGGGLQRAAVLLEAQRFGPAKVLISDGCVSRHGCATLSCIDGGGSPTG